MDRKDIYLGIDKDGNVRETEVVLNELLKEDYYPPHFEIVDYYE